MDNPDGARSRVFMIVAIGLVGLLMIGILSIAGLVVYTRFLAPSTSPTVVAAATVSPTSTRAATATLAASATTPSTGGAPTATRVVQAGASPTPGEAVPTATPTGEETIPDTGFGPFEAVLGGVILLLVILFVRRLRFSGQS